MLPWTTNTGRYHPVCTHLNNKNVDRCYNDKSGTHLCRHREKLNSYIYKLIFNLRLNFEIQAWFWHHLWDYSYSECWLIIFIKKKKTFSQLWEETTTKKLSVKDTMTACRHGVMTWNHTHHSSTGCIWHSRHFGIQVPIKSYIQRRQRRMDPQSLRNQQFVHCLWKRSAPEHVSL